MKKRLAFWSFFWLVQLAGVGLGCLTHHWLFMSWCIVWSYYGLVKFNIVLDEIFKIVYHQP